MANKILKKVKSLDKHSRQIRKSKDFDSSYTSTVKASVLADELASKTKGQSRAIFTRLTNELGSLEKLHNMQSAGDLEMATLRKANKKVRSKVKKAIKAYVEILKEDKANSDKENSIQAKVTEKVTAASMDFLEIDKILKQELENEKNADMFSAFREKSQPLYKAVKKAKKSASGMAFARAPIIVIGSGLVPKHFKDAGIPVKRAANSLVLEDQLVIIHYNAKKADMDRKHSSSTLTDDNTSFINSFNKANPNEKISMVNQKIAHIVMDGANYSVIWVMPQKDINNFSRVNNNTPLHVRTWDIFK